VDKSWFFVCYWGKESKHELGIVTQELKNQNVVLSSKQNKENINVELNKNNESNRTQQTGILHLVNCR
jgi:hypothetical protein